MHGSIDSVFRVEWRPLSELSAVAAQWRELAERALEPNVFYEPAFALAALRVFGREVGAGLVWERHGRERLLGFFPARIEHRRFGVPLPVLVGWTHPFAPLGAPLVDRETGEAAIAAWLDHAAGHPHLPRLMLLPCFPDDGKLARAFDAALARRGGRSASLARHYRALLEPRCERAGYLDRAVGRRKRKELRRQRKRLGDLGIVSRAVTGDPDAVARALGDFLALEAGGWKGRAGSAARNHPDIEAFMAEAVGALAGAGKAQVARLFVDTRTVAAIVTLRSGPSAWVWKIAYDEHFARFSPGAQLLVDVTQALLDDPTVERADSCATADHPLIDHVWRERLAIADRLVSVGAGNAPGFALAHAGETLRRAAIGAAKAVREIVRR